MPSLPLSAPLSNNALEGRPPISETRRLRLREALAPDASALLGLAPETLPVQRAPKVHAGGTRAGGSPERLSGGQRSHSRRRRGEGGLGDAAGPGLSVRAVGGPGPSSPGNLSGQRGGSHGARAAHKRPRPFSLRKGLCYLAQAASVRAARAGNPNGPAAKQNRPAAVPSPTGPRPLGGHAVFPGAGQGLPALPPPGRDQTDPGPWPLS